MKITARKTGTLAGYAGTGLALLASLITALFYIGCEGERYSPFNHWISDLGNPDLSKLFPVFNIGLIISGIVLVVFFIALGIYFRHWWTAIAAAVGVYAAFNIILVGAIPENHLSQHLKVAGRFFAAGEVTLILFTVYAFYHLFTKENKPSRWMFLPGLISAVSLIVFMVVYQLNNSPDKLMLLSTVCPPHPPFELLPTLEWAVFVTFLGWVTATAYGLTKSPPHRFQS